MNPIIPDLLDQIIERYIAEDNAFKKQQIEKFGTYGVVSGEPMNIFYLKVLKELIQKEMEKDKGEKTDYKNTK